MSRAPIPTYTFALVVVKAGRKVALVRDRKDGVAWSLPGGRVEAGEELLSAARRYAANETGMPVELEGLLRVQHTLVDGGESRLRICVVARPADDRALKTVADEHSLTAQWFTREQLATLSLKSGEVKQFVDLALDGPVYPLSLLTWEKG
ncbi:MAG: NUDIX domain-containing protein [Myxococcaceae bacterium]|nr:NUDIX domain-containing protein [Myxococcaceae bacterium]